MSDNQTAAYPRPLDLGSVSIEDRYWTPYLNLVRHTVIPYQWEALNDRIPDAEPSHAIRNFRIAAGAEPGAFEGFVFQDTDLYKWLEAVGFSLSAAPDADLERIADEAIALIASAQQPDGYLNTYFTVAEPGRRWTNLTDCHELYTAGHLIEAAVAYYDGTGKKNLLDVACRLADHIDSVFGDGPDRIRGYDGHQEIELALVKLYEATGEHKYLKLAAFFIDERGREPHFFHQEWEARGRTTHWTPGVVQTRPPALDYLQAHKPVREQEVATGHAVRAVYMYTAMADLALHKGDASLLAACKRLWRNVADKQLYINGSIGSTHHGEAFTFDYDLPNDTNYSETCASIGLIFFARRMLQAEPKGEYGDILERALYNTVTAGMAADGKHYFYVNPMEVWPAASAGNPGKHHVKAVRQKWYGCACCPPNVARLLSSLGQYVFAADEQTLYTHLFVSGEAKLTLAGRQVALRTASDLPWEGAVSLTLTEASGSGAFALAVRVPSWSKRTSFALNGVPLAPEIRDGYAYVSRDWRAGDVLTLALDMQPRRIYAHPNVRANAGRVALQRGPLVYCLEETDNGAPLVSLALRAEAELRPVAGEGRLAGVVLLETEGVRLAYSEAPSEAAALYRTEPPEPAPQRLLAVPYSLWGNREPGEMLVWIREQS
ncbi:glycoside hydrolase family 127 protein [Cohnella nanjingensis]|uniref:Glycoside hydrolase family 127 protein n=1 Tax=Cohnella nanjingensis TaxID=1387779 RepID=A0A7X0RTW3_9BACL|nr:beta-L-arabinofuranosidase domain-containing protein [Cohnella nanjingensis]MBB6673505.1 glycoside hydrolase family 127 protein [Cohnella nanjingensis]